MKNDILNWNEGVTELTEQDSEQEKVAGRRKE